MTEGLEVDGEQFFVAQLPSGDKIYPDQEQAVEELKSNGSGLQDNSDDVTIIEVSYEDEDWEIKEVPWKDIALLLLEVQDG